MSQEALALAAEVDRSYLGRIERGDNNAALLTLLRIAESLQYPSLSFYAKANFRSATQHFNLNVAGAFLHLTYSNGLTGDEGRKERQQNVIQPLADWLKKTLKDMILSIRLSYNAWIVPFAAKARKYPYRVTADLTSKGKTSAEVQADDRAKFLSATASDVELETAQMAAEASDRTAGSLPF
jgi:transcriptional regulator with XRE-family HTH domain